MGQPAKSWEERWNASTCIGSDSSWRSWWSWLVESWRWLQGRLILLTIPHAMSDPDWQLDNLFKTHGVAVSIELQPQCWIEPLSPLVSPESCPKSSQKWERNKSSYCVMGLPWFQKDSAHCTALSNNKVKKILALSIVKRCGCIRAESHCSPPLSHSRALDWPWDWQCTMRKWDRLVVLTLSLCLTEPLEHTHTQGDIIITLVDVTAGWVTESLACSWHIVSGLWMNSIAENVLLARSGKK